MNLPLTLAVADAVVAIYLLVWALRRERRDKPLVVSVGLVLSICAVFLAVPVRVPFAADAVGFYHSGARPTSVR